jgi:hypothetical protein
VSRYAGATGDGARLFVKVIGDHPSYYTAETRAQHHLAGTAIRTPRLVDHGILDEKRR